ncbi:hypothetical protein [Aquimarina algiphila]|uniref:hypothetical protein n=1 Tax=Aquimarina algiphila TaxID=2047982 RepID=UPI00232FA053|nr:hypothetical protein [Aquimarina algiphila]
MSNTQVFLIHLVELIAAVAGTIYLNKNREDLPSRYFVWFLWFTVVIEKIGLVRRFVLKSEYLDFLKDTIIGESNYWIYNPYLIISVFFYVRYLMWNIRSKKIRSILNFLSYLYVFSSIVNFISYSEKFFNSHSAYGFIVGSTLILLSIILYFYEVLQDDIILEFKKSLPFYVTAGVLVFYLTVTPFFIHSKYYSTPNPGFIKIYTFIITIANIIMYTCYTIGFVVCLRKNRSY